VDILTSVSEVNGEKWDGGVEGTTNGSELL